MEELKKTPRTGMEAAGQQTGLSLAEAEKRIVQSAAGSMIEIGYYLKQIRDVRLYEEKGYKTSGSMRKRSLVFINQRHPVI